MSGAQESHGVRTVGVVGAGQMGGGIAQVAAVAGFETVVHDASAGALERCEAAHRQRLERAVEKGRVSSADAAAALGRLRYARDLSAVCGGDLVIEAVVEDEGVKRELFATLDREAADGAILASNTSSISITAIASAAADPGRVIGMHFFHPVPVMGLVEVIEGLATEASVTARVVALAGAMGKTAVRAKDRAGFVSNRVLMPMINEAFLALMGGVAEAEAIDEVMRLGCNFPMGPLRLADFIGLDTCCQIMDVLAVGLNGERYRPCPLLRQLVVAGRLGQKSGRGVYAYG